LEYFCKKVREKGQQLWKEAEILYPTIKKGSALA
jgi:hypothetical protein